MRKILTIIAAVSIFSGFGMIHGDTTIVERSGSVLIGIGALYLLYVLFTSDKKKANTE